MRAAKKQAKAFVIIELIITSSIIAILMSVMLVSLKSFAKFNSFQLERQRCVAAAQAQLDALSIAGRALAEGDMKRLWPGVTCTIERSAGSGDWQGFEFVKVKTTALSYKKPVLVELGRYIPTTKEAQH